jgi:hypothetical protein
MAGIIFAMSGVLCVYPYGGPLPPLKFINETVDGLNFQRSNYSLHLLIKISFMYFRINDAEEFFFYVESARVARHR